MPLARYFIFTGGALLALLFLFNWSQPSPTAVAARSEIDRSTIRVHSQHKWPSAVVFDTAQPAIVPAAVAAVVSETPVIKAVEPAKPPLEALAMVQPRDQPAVQPVAAAAPKRTVRRSKMARTPARAPRIASYETFGFGNPFQTNW